MAQTSTKSIKVRPWTHSKLLRLAEEPGEKIDQTLKRLILSYESQHRTKKEPETGEIDAVQSEMPKQ